MTPSTIASSRQTGAIGLDVGGTKIAAGIVTFPSSEVRARQTIPTRPERGGEAVLTDALNLARVLIAEAMIADLDLLGIGVGVPELVDLDGQVTSGQTIAWRGMSVQSAFSQLAPTAVDSDVRAAARAEAMFGVGQHFRLFVYVTVGTGISSCLVQDGVPYAGARGNAVVLASGPWTTVCTSCGGMSKSVLEEIASGPALVTRYKRAGVRQASQGEDVIAAVKENDPVAIEVVRTAGEALGASVGFLINVLDPEAVILGGGLGLSGGLYWDSFESACREHIWANCTRALPILRASLGTDAGLIGAAAALLRT